jgi:hypothetical protein
MGQSNQFAELLSIAVRTIAARENVTIAIVQDELGYALGRETGGSSIEYWRKGHVPANPRDLVQLVKELVVRDGLDRAASERFLRSAGYPYSSEMLDELFMRIERAPSRPEPPPRPLSPFVVGPPVTVPRQFYGRARELKRIFALWRRFPLQHVALIGPKRSGKTSLLHHLKAIALAAPAALRPGQRADWLPGAERYRWVFVDFQDARMSSQDRLLRYLLSSLDMPAPNPCSLDAFMDVASHYLRAPTVVLMDEIEAGLAAPELDEPFWGSLRSLANNYTGGSLAFVLAAHEQPMQLAQDSFKPSPFFNIFHSLELGPFTDAEARELIASSPQPPAAKEVDWMLETSGRWPCLLQILCLARLTVLEEGETGDAWREEGVRQIAPFRYLLA